MNRLRGLLTLALMAGAFTPVHAQQDSARTDLPLDRGRLRQDDIAMEWNRATLAIRFVPLDERVIRLLSPDAAQSLHALLQGARARIDSATSMRGIRDPGIALVTFHALAPGTRFDPQLLSLSVRGQLWRAVATVPLSTAWGNDQLDVRSAAIGLVIFDHPIPVREAFNATYAEASSVDWGLRLAKFDTERARILGTVRPAVDTLHQR
jgi:hypothetical protein